MQRFLLQCAAVGLVALLAASPASAEKKGGVLRVFMYDSPASMSIHEEALNSAQNPMMAVFNNLVMFDQHVAAEQYVDDRARSGNELGMGRRRQDADLQAARGRQVA